MLRAPAHDLGLVLRDILHGAYGAAEAEVYLADYQLLALHPLLAEPATPLPITGTAAGRVFSDQESRLGADGSRWTAHLPMSVRGDRQGVLRVSWDHEPDPALQRELGDLAHAAAQALLVAENVTDRYRLARRTQRLTLAAEMQWQLLPGRGLEYAEFVLAGQLEPAYAVHGDNFDWTADGDQLTIAVTNGMGESVDAALLTSLAIHALRNARRAGVGLADQAALADQAIWAQHGGRLHVSTLLLRIERASGRVTAVDAGSPRIWRVRAGQVQPVPLEPQLPLGMFDSTVYTEQEFTVAAGDRIFVLSDGVFDAVVGQRRFDTTLERMLRNTRALSPGQAIHALMHDLRAFYSEIDLDDDAVAVCLDWTGAPASG